jgi:hypothetical protein
MNRFTKHRKAHNHGKSGLQSGNPRYSRAKAKNLEHPSNGDRDTRKLKTMVGW